jgi:replicative DNA helicase
VAGDDPGWDDAPEGGEVEDGQPPQDIPSEQSVLGAVLLSYRALDEVAGVLTAEDFYRPAHGQIWAAVVSLWTAREPVDAVTVSVELDRRGELLRIGGAPYLHTLTQVVPTAVNVRYYADIVTEKATLRRLREFGLRTAQLAEHGARGANVDEVLDFARREFAEATATRDQSSVLVPAEDAVWSFIESLDEPPAGLVKTSWPALDKQLSGGLLMGELVVVAANTSVGKSLFGQALARAAAQDGHRVAMFALEMTRDEVMARIVADVGTVPLTDLIEHNLGAEDQYRAKKAAERIQEWPLWVDDTPGLSVAQIRARCQQLGDVGLVVVDQLSLMSPADSRVSREQQVARISWELKELAKQLGCPIVLLHQLNSEPTKRIGGRPAKEDLRESRAVGHNASKVMLLWRRDDEPSDITVIVDKHRNGPTGDVQLRFVGKYARIGSSEGW